MIQGLPKNLMTERKSRKLTQRQLAEILGLSAAVISGYETGERTPSLAVLVDYANYFGCTADYLLGRSEPASSEQFISCEGLNDIQIETLQALIRSMRK